MQGSAVAVMFAVTNDPLQCGCRRCQPQAREVERELEAVIARIIREADSNPWNQGTSLLLDLVHGDSTLEQYRERIASYLDGLHECFCPCESGEIEVEMHVPACPLIDAEEG